jgi:hypothetical protein
MSEVLLSGAPARRLCGALCRILPAALAALALSVSAASAQVASGSYTGTGLDDQVVADIGFLPDVVIVKGDVKEVAVIRTSTMAGDAAKPMIGSVALTANLIQSLNPGNFVIGNDPRVNSLLVEYYWVAFKAVPGKLKVGTYTGNGAANRAITGAGFSPEMVFVFSASTGAGVAATQDALAAGANGLDFGTVSTGGWFSSLDADGFTLGSALTENNANGVAYHYVAFNQIEGQVTQGSYVGSNGDNRNITGLGFQPEYVMVLSAANRQASHHSASVGAAVDSTQFFGDVVNGTDRIQALLADGFQVGTNNDVNQNTKTFFYLAWARLNGPPRVLSGTYTGTGADNRTISGLGFAPDVVLVKGDTTQIGAFRTSTMIGDAAKPSIGATALVANQIQSLTGDGFTVGDGATVNASGVAYHWVAWSAGAGEMVVSTYTGTGGNPRSLTGLGFQPELVWIFSAGASEGVWRSAANGSSYNFDTGAPTALVTSLDADGFTVNADARVNAGGTVYHYVAWNEIAGKMRVGSYAGNNNDDRNITGVGFQPELVLVKRNAGGYSVLSHPRRLRQLHTGAAGGRFPGRQPGQRQPDRRHVRVRRLEARHADGRAHGGDEGGAWRGRGDRDLAYRIRSRQPRLRRVSREER